MADTVRYLMEAMVPELEDLQRKKYFSRAEIRLIIKKREEFEYLLKRKAALKQDFLRCAAMPPLPPCRVHTSMPCFLARRELQSSYVRLPLPAAAATAAAAALPPTGT
jgi:hypothetical protein